MSGAQSPRTIDFSNGETNRVLDPEEEVLMKILEKILKKHKVTKDIEEKDYIKFKPR